MRAAADIADAARVALPLLAQLVGTFPMGSPENTALGSLIRAVGADYEAEGHPVVERPAALTERQAMALDHLEDVAQDVQVLLDDSGISGQAQRLRGALAGMRAAGFPMRGAAAGTPRNGNAAPAHCPHTGKAVGA